MSAPGVPFGTRRMRSPSKRALSSSYRSSSAPSPSSSAVLFSSLRTASSSLSLSFWLFLEVLRVPGVQRDGVGLFQRLALFLKALVHQCFVVFLHRRRFDF